MKFDEKDYKLLNKLYHSYRKPSTKIAKELGFTREQVNYRINKYLSEELIRKFACFFDYSELGYNCFIALYVKLDKPKNQKKLSEELKKSRNCISWGYVYGKYDLWANMIFENENNFGKYLSEILSKFNILDYQILRPYFTEQFPLKFFENKEKTMNLIPSQKSEKIKLDETDKKIIKELSKNSRAKLVDIAGEAGISSELALHRMKRLEKQGVILGSRIQFNMEKLGYHFSQVFLDIKNFSEENKKKVREFAKNSKHAHNLVFCLSKPNCMIQFFHKNQSDLKKAIEEIKKLFPEEILDLDFMLISEDIELINTLPFLEYL